MGKIRSFKKHVRLGIFPAFALIALIITAGFTYNFFVLKPQKEIALLELQKTQQGRKSAEERDKKLDACLEESYKKYRDRWGRNCETQGRKVDDEGRCPLPSDLVDHLDNEYKNLRDECLTRYK